MAGTWHFTPAEGATSDVADADYLHYGFWLKKTTDADGATTYNEVQTFAGSSIPERVKALPMSRAAQPMKAARSACM